MAILYNLTTIKDHTRYLFPVDKQSKNLENSRELDINSNYGKQKKIQED